jgi:N6-L-threonylcarbamoyladenine synthase
VAGEWAALDRPLLLAGNGLRKYRALFAEALGSNATFATEGLWPPSAKGTMAAYARALELGERSDGDPGTVLPIYTRLSDAEEAEVARRGFEAAGGTVPGSGVAGEGPR